MTEFFTPIEQREQTEKILFIEFLINFAFSSFLLIFKYACGYSHADEKLKNPKMGSFLNL